jgi:dipeptidyl aminopeptidase/acylaminoacyl peptidase
MDPGRHLAFVTSDALDLDLSDENQRRFGDYELLELVGEGGMGVVYRARQLSLDREVAVKLLSAGPWASRDFVERFQREAQNAARMQHPNIVPIHEVGTIEGLHFFSMRLIRGTSLAAQVKRAGRLPAMQAAQLVRIVAEAVDYAHRLGVLHLDLKPANVLMDENGEPHVADFGLARRLDQMRAADNTEVSGTPSYMAPEQATARAQKITPATDIWGLGAVLYELVTGTPPFLADSAQATLQLVVQGNLRNPRDMAPDLPRDLEAIILKCMARGPDERYASARELADDLGRFVDKRPVRARPLNAAQRAQRWVRREPKLAAATLLAFAALLAGLVATTQEWRRADDNAATARRTAWSQRIDAVWQSYDRGDWFAALPRLVANLHEQEASGATGEAEVERRRIGILFANSPRLIDEIATGGSVIAADISPDGKRVAAMSRRADVNGTNLATLRLIEIGTGAVAWQADLERGVDFPRFSADGRSLYLDDNVLGQNFEGYGPGAMRRFAVADGTELPLPFAVSEPQLVVYAHASTAALVADHDGVMRLWHTDRPDAPSAWHRMFEGSAGPTRVMLSDDGGSLVYAAGTPPSIELIDTTTGAVQLRFALDPGEQIKGLRISPDGRRVAVATDAARVVVASLDWKQERTLSERCEPGYAPIAFSNDSRLLATTCVLRTTIWDARDLAAATVPIDHDDHPWLLALDATQRTLFVTESGNPRVYQLPPALDRFAVPMPVTPLMLGRTERDYWPAAFDPANRLLVLGTRTGLLKLWRLQPDARLPMTGAPIAPPDLSFDGERLVTVRVSDAFVVDAGDGHALGPALAHPDPVWLAETLPDDGVLTASGRTLRVWNGRTGALRFAPLVLADTPWRVIPTPDGAAVLTSVAEYRDGRCREHLQLWRTTDGTLAAETDVAGPLEGARFAPDGSHLIGWRGSEVWLRDGATLAGPSLSVQHKDAAGPVDVVEARMGSADELQATTRRRNINYAAYYWRWDARTGALREQLQLAGMAHRFATAPTGAFASAGSQGVATLQVQRRTIGGTLDWLPFPRLAETAPGLAYDQSASMLAEAMDLGVLLIDAATGTALSPPLASTLLGNDRSAMLAFDPSGRRVLSRSAYGRLLRWDISPDMRRLAEIEGDAALYAPRSDAGWIKSAPALAPEVRATLRARDPGAPLQALEETPFNPGATVLPRAADTGTAQLDLGHFYTPLEDNENERRAFQLRSVPIGRQRLLGVDFDIRGMIQLAGSIRPPQMQTFADHVDGIPLPAHADALDVLFGEYSGESTIQPHLDVIFHYRDGGERRVELGVRGSMPYPFPVDADPLGEAESWRGARIAWLGDRRLGPSLITPPVPIYLVRAENPEPARELATLSLVARLAPYVLAISVEAPTQIGSATH